MLAGYETSEDRKYHLTFKRTKKIKGRKTIIYNVLKDGYMDLGKVKWHGAFRQYCFYPLSDTMFSKGCLELINTFMDKVNKRYRKKIRKAHADSKSEDKDALS